jgi:chromosome segregation ATPase
MNQLGPEGRIDKLEEEQKEIKKRLTELERQTEPIKISRVELDMGDVRERFDTIERSIQASKEELTKEFDTVSKTWLDSLQEIFDELKVALVDVTMTQGSHNERFDHIETTMATKDDIAELKATIATKDDIASLKDLIQQLLPPKPDD